MQQKIRIEAADGASAEIHPLGATVLSWKPAGEGERLFLSRAATFGAGMAIRGGIPVCFPQFAGFGNLPKHGFARNSAWQLAGERRREDGAAQARLRLCDSHATRALWPHGFVLELQVTVFGKRLETELELLNCDDRPFSFTGALHTYLRVRDVAAVRLLGLKGCYYQDSTRGGQMVRQADEALTVNGELDRIYLEPPAQLRLDEAGRSVQIRHEGFAETVVWNPGAERAAALNDLEAGGWMRMLCVEAAAFHPVEVAPGARWRGAQQLEILG